MFGSVVPVALVLRLLSAACFAIYSLDDFCDFIFYKSRSSIVDCALGDNSEPRFSRNGKGYLSIRLDM